LIVAHTLPSWSTLRVILPTGSDTGVVVVFFGAGELYALVVAVRR